MQNQICELRLCLHEDLEDHELDRVTRRLLDEIKELDVDFAQLSRDQTLPTGAKGDPVAIGEILVAFASAGVLKSLVDLLQSWLLRRGQRNISIKAKVGDNQVELQYSPLDVSQEKMTEFSHQLIDLLQNPKQSRALGRPAS